MKKFKDYKKEDAPANNTSGVANWNPLLGKSPRVMVRKKKKLDLVNLTNLNDYKVDGRKKNYRAAVKRIRERQEKLRERELKKKLSMFGMQGNPFIPTFTKEETELKEDTIMSKKYLETRPGSLEAAVHRAVDSETPQINPDTGRAILTLPKNKYLNTKEGSLENAVEQVLVEKHDPSDYDPATHTQVGSRQKIKPSFNTKTHRLIVKDGTVKVIAKAIWRARGKVLRQQGWSLAEALDDVNPKALKGKHKDRKDADIDNDGDVDSTDKYLHKRRKAISKSVQKEDHNCEAVHPEINHKEWLAQEKDAKDQDKDPVGKEEEVDEIHSAKDGSQLNKSLAKFKKQGGEVQQLKPGARLKGMPSAQKKMHKALKREAREIGTAAYANYAKEMTPGEEPDVRVKGKDERQAAIWAKAVQAQKERQATRIDDAVDPAIEAQKQNFSNMKDRLTKQHITRMSRLKRRAVGEETEEDALEEATFKVKVAGLPTIYMDGTSSGSVKASLRKMVKRPEDIETVDRITTTDYKKELRGRIKGDVEEAASTPKDDHATALYKDQWKDRKRADWDKEHGREKMAKQDRADAGEDRKRMKKIDKDWKHAKDETGEKEKKEEMSPLLAAVVDRLSEKWGPNRKLKTKKRQDDLDRDDEAEATRSKKHPTAEAIKAHKKMKKQNLLDRDDEAEATRSKKHPTAEETHSTVEAVTRALSEKEVDVPDTRRTVDAIRAYYRAKDASRDATSDTDKGKKKKGDIEKKYAKKERGEIDKDDPDWKHKKGHTGMHGEDVNLDELSDAARMQYDASYKSQAAAQKAREKESLIAAKARADKKTEENDYIEPKMGQSKWHDQLKDKETMRKLPKGATTKALQAKEKEKAPKGSTAEEINPLIQATVDKIHFMRDDKLSYKERQDLPKGDFALPGKGTGPEGKQGGSYPIPDASHARNALARVAQHGTEAEIRKVREAVKKKFPDIDVHENVEVAVTEKHVPGETTATHTSVGTKHKIKPQYNTKTHKLITLPNGNVKVVPKSTPGMEAEEVEETNLLIQATIDELSKKTLGSYVKKAASSSTDAGMALQRSTDKPGGQTRGDVDKHVGTLTKRRKGIATAADKLSKEDVELDEIGFAQAGKIASAQAIARGRAKEKEADDRELALKKKGVKKIETSRGTFYSKAEAREVDEGPTPEFKPEKHKEWSAPASIPKSAMPKKPGKLAKYKVGKSGMAKFQPTKEEVEIDETEWQKQAKFDREARRKSEKQHDEREARYQRQKATAKKEEVEVSEAKVDAMATIDRIVKDKQASHVKLGGKKHMVDLYTASAIQQVYNKVNTVNQQKMNKLLNKDINSFKKVAQLAFSNVK